MSGNHVSSDRIGEAAQHGGLDTLRDIERRHVESCDECKRLYAGYRMADRLLAASWSEVRLPHPMAAPRPKLAPVFDFMSRLNTRRFAPIIAGALVLALVGATLALPRLLPAPAAGSPSAVAEVTPAPNKTSAAPSSSASQQAGQSETPGSSQTGSTISTVALAMARFGGQPIAWSPDGAHLLVWGNGQIVIRDSSGRTTGSAAADAAVWVTSSTIAIATPASPASTPTPHGRRNPAKGNLPEAVRLIDVRGNAAGTVPGTFPAWTGIPNGMLVSDGRGDLTIAGQYSSGPSGWQFQLWNGSLSQKMAGMPIVFSNDGSALAVLHPVGANVNAVGGSLSIVATATLKVTANLHVNLRATTGNRGSAFGFDAAFSPNEHSLLVSGTLVDLGSGASTPAGTGGWLPNGTLVTGSPQGLLRWTGTSSKLDARFDGPGSVYTSLSGDLIYVFTDGRPPLLLDSNGAFEALTLTGMRSVGDLLISPSGRVIALDGRATDGTSTAAVAALP